jgi:hypothetical protein
MTTRSEFAAESSDREVIVTRIFDTARFQELLVKM